MLVGSKLVNIYLSVYLGSRFSCRNILWKITVKDLVFSFQENLNKKLNTQSLPVMLNEIYLWCVCEKISEGRNRLKHGQWIQLMFRLYFIKDFVRQNINWICCLCFGLSIYFSHLVEFFQPTISPYIYIYIVMLTKESHGEHKKGW